MDRATFLAVLTSIVEGFEDPTFKNKFGAARAAGDTASMIGLPLGIQYRAFETNGLEGPDTLETFKAAGKIFGNDPAVGPLMARMKAALG